MSRWGRTLLAGAAPVSGRAAARAAAALAVPPALWFVHLNMSYVLVPPSCSLGGRWPFALVTLVALGAMAPAAVVSWRAWQRAAGPDGADALLRFLGASGLVLAALFATATLLVAGSVVVIEPCA